MTNNKVNLALIQELNTPAVMADEQGYWKARGMEEFPGWAELPFKDFFEDLSTERGDGHKKMWLNPDGTIKANRLSDKRESLIPLYSGIVDTQRLIVSAGFFWYSALIIQLHLILAYYSRSLDVVPTVKAVVESGNAAAAEDVKSRTIALRVAAFIVYEGDGLGGYKAENWAFYGRLFGQACPTCKSILDIDGAAQAQKEYKEADDAGKLQLFTKWWNLIHSNKSTGEALYSNTVIKHLHTAFRMVTRYQLMESPFCPEDLLFDKNNSFDIQSALAGFFRRSSKGLGEAGAYDSNNTDVHRFSDMLVDDEYKPLAKVNRFLTGKNGLTPFGEYIINIIEIHQLRNELVDRITERDEDSVEAKEGFATRLSKRGRRHRM